MNVIGIDPGKTGGVSFFSQDWLHVEKLPQSSPELLGLMRDYFPNPDEVAVYLEQIYLPSGKAGG